MKFTKIVRTFDECHAALDRVQFTRNYGTEIETHENGNIVLTIDVPGHGQGRFIRRNHGYLNSLGFELVS